MKKTTLIGVGMNITISITMFCSIFYSCAGVSGGDMAIAAGNIFFGLFQIFAIAVWERITKKKATLIILSIVILRVAELIFFLKYGYEINEWLKRF